MDENLKHLTDWNEKNPIGTRVRVSNADGSTFDTYTTSEARFLGSNVVVVWVDHKYGCRTIRNVEAIE